jgi:hypothetical protein
VLRLHDAEERTPNVHDQQLGLLGALRPDYLAAQGPQRGGLAALAVAEDQKVSVAVEIDCHRAQSVLLQPEQNPRPEFDARSAQDVLVIYVCG